MPETPRFKIDQYGNHIYYDDTGSIHRTGGPAIVASNGYKEWRHHGELHRTDGPAMKEDNKPYWYLFGYRCWKYEHNRLSLFNILEPSRCVLSFSFSQKIRAIKEKK
jgi:hypothetical protein